MWLWIFLLANSLHMASPSIHHVSWKETATQILSYMQCNSITLNTWIWIFLTSRCPYSKAHAQYGYIYINMNKIICLFCALEEFQRSISINNTFDPTIFDMNHWAELVEWKWKTYLMEGLTFFPSSASFEEHILLLHTFLHKNITICFFEYFF